MDSLSMCSKRRLAAPPKSSKIVIRVFFDCNFLSIMLPYAKGVLLVTGTTVISKYIQDHPNCNEHSY